jgi:hypothetical protein
MPQRNIPLDVFLERINSPFTSMRLFLLSIVANTSNPDFIVHGVLSNMPPSLMSKATFKPSEINLPALLNEK